MSRSDWIRRENNLNAAFDVLDILVAYDYRVEIFHNELHWKINGTLNVWPSTRKYYNDKTGERGVYDDLVRLVRGMFESYPQKPFVSR